MTETKIDKHLSLTDISTAYENRHKYKTVLVAVNPIKGWKPDYYYPMEDSEHKQTNRSLKHLRQAVKAIERETHKKHDVQLSCHAGLHRSAGVAICYLMKKYGMSEKEALRYIQKRRPAVELRPAIKKALQKACR